MSILPCFQTSPSSTFPHAPPVPPPPAPGHLPDCLWGAGMVKVCCRPNVVSAQILLLKLNSQGDGVGGGVGGGGRGLTGD